MGPSVCLFCSLLLGLTFSAGEAVRDGSPLGVREGNDALLTCIVRSLGGHVVVWKKREQTRWRVLTAAESTITTDPRFSVIHDQGGDVWVLAIANASKADSGLYMCEVNSLPPVQTLHKLSVSGEEKDEVDSARTRASHNYTECCRALNVSSSCLGFCDIQSILDGNTGTDPENCEHNFPAIVRCMADGRNHVPCCIEQQVPDICQDVCRGEYTVITDNIKTHFSCAAYTEPTLACILSGIEILPSMPLNVEVEGVSETSMKVHWDPPYHNPDTVDRYDVNVTRLNSFDQPKAKEKDARTLMTLTVTLKAKENVTTEVLVSSLEPLTMYEVSVVAHNSKGSSLPSQSVRSLTLVPGQTRSSPAIPPALPDVKQCCHTMGVTHSTCVEKLCDLSVTEETEVTDLMICAPWAQQTFSCLANNKDHSPCCKARGLPDLCVQLCSGNFTSLNFSFFKCIKYMPTYRSCLMQGYGVLPGPPEGLKVSNVFMEFAVVQWRAPRTLPESVTHYNVHFRALQDEQYITLYEVQSPFVLERLDSDTLYEVFVTAANKYGVGDPSQRVLFSTHSKEWERGVEESTSGYNVTECCVAAGLSLTCMPLCTYDASMSQLKSLASTCAPEFSKLLRCAAGGRNHSPCCSQRGVASSCLPLCAGVVISSLSTITTTCIPFIGNIVQCFEQGTGLLPGPVGELHATSVTSDSVSLAWEPPTDSSNISSYIIHYKKVDNTSMHETLLKLDNQVKTEAIAETLKGLEHGALYNIFVVAENLHGTSLPSSILLINVTDSGKDGKIAGVTSPPHSLAISSHSATYVTFTWQPPEFSHPAEQLTYKVYHKSQSASAFNISTTSVTSHTLEGLSPNTQYIVYVIAVSAKGDSLPSETLIAWTDPAFPAYVEPPTVHPINLVVEGSSMTVLCIAMGTPMPTISLYISGRMIRQEATRHMVTVVKNVSRDMNHISCYADNGYGTPMEARRKIIISYKPHISPSGITMATHGETVKLECIVEAQPAPKMMFWKDYAKRVPVINGGMYEANTSKYKDDEDKWLMTLTIKSIKDTDDGDYYCHAENAFGNDTQPVSVRLRNVAAANNVTQCCLERNVSSVCMDACSFYLDIDAVIDKPECINDFDKLMKCGSDGSDHRSCCVYSGVERGCLDWCRGEPLFGQDHKGCLLHHTKKIMSCFREGRDRLPGPPLNVRVERIDDHSVMIRWDPPVKNPHTVDMYRVFWRAVSSSNPVAQKNDSKMTSLRVTGLKSGVTYECVVKAANSRGTSALTAPLQFSTDEKYIISAASVDEEEPTYGMAVGLVVAVGAVAAVVIGTVWFVRSSRLHKSSSGVAFENPSYLREVNMDHMQTNEAGGWRQEQLQVPTCTEVPPSIYEELKLGHDGAGFKRLKP